MSAFAFYILALSQIHISKMSSNIVLIAPLPHHVQLISYFILNALHEKSFLTGRMAKQRAKNDCLQMPFVFEFIKHHRADKWDSVLFSFRLGVLATPDAVVSRPVAQLSIPINGYFEIVRGM